MCGISTWRSDFVTQRAWALEIFCIKIFYDTAVLQFAKDTRTFVLVLHIVLREHVFVNVESGFMHKNLSADLPCGKHVKTVHGIVSGGASGSCVVARWSARMAPETCAADTADAGEGKGLEDVRR